MKTKSLLILALSAMAIGGCMKSEIDDASYNSANAVSFSSSTDKQTKASVLDNDNAQSYDFSVFAYSTGETAWASYSPLTANFMYDQKVEYSEEAWTYTPIKYWPDNDGEMVSFFGYMPYSSATVASLNTSSNLPEIVFTQNMAAASMIDLTVAQALDQSKANSTVTMSFEHILTRMNFAAKTEKAFDGATEVYVTGLKVLGTGSNTSSKLYSTATYELADGTKSNGVWSYEAETTAIASDDIDLATILKDAGDYIGIKISDEATSLLTTTNDYQQYLFLIPPSATGVAADTDIYIEVSYSVVTADTGLGNDSIQIDATATLTMPVGTLLSEYAYNVVLTIGLDEVLMDIEVSDDMDAEEGTTDTDEVIFADSLDDLIALITDAFADDTLDSYSVTYSGEDTALAIDLSDITANLDMDLTINLPDVESAVTITTNTESYVYTGQLTVYAPSATVTLVGDFTNPITTTAPTTLIIAASSKVTGLTISGGNVVVYGTLTGDVSRSSYNTDDTTIIDKMEGCTYSVTSIGSDILVNTAYGPATEIEGNIDDCLYITGVVTDSNGEALEGVTVSDGTETETTDANGYYTLSLADNDTKTVSFTYDGYISVNATAIFPSDATAGATVVVSQELTAAVETQYVDAGTAAKLSFACGISSFITLDITEVALTEGVSLGATKCILAATPTMSTNLASLEEDDSESLTIPLAVVDLVPGGTTFEEPITLAIPCEEIDGAYHAKLVEGNWKTQGEVTYNEDSYELELTSFSQHAVVVGGTVSKSTGGDSENTLAEYTLTNIGNADTRSGTISYAVQSGWSSDSDTLSAFISQVMGASAGISTMQKTLYVEAAGDEDVTVKITQKVTTMTFTIGSSSQTITRYGDVSVEVTTAQGIMRVDHDE